ncbi:MAG: hypothetical protein ACSHYF_04625 [Verrucomicrobiaceae bacterium]
MKTNASVAMAVLLEICFFGSFAAGAAEPGTLVHWGSTSWQTNEIPSGLEGKIVSASSARYHVLVVEENGSVHGWGGDGTDSDGVSTIPAGLDDVVAVAAGETISIALKANGEVVSWGPSFTNHADTPASLNGVVVTAISAGNHHGLAVTADSEVETWGFGVPGSLSVPAGLDDIVDVAGGGWHSLALRANGTVVAWGYNGYGQTDVPAGLSNVAAISAGDYHSLALLNDGTIVAWGRNNSGQTDIPSGLDQVTAIDCALDRSIALRSDGSIVAWGFSNWHGQEDIPADMGPAIGIAAGGNHNFAITNPSAPAAGTSIPYIPAGDEWYYHDEGTTPSGSWKEDPYDISIWDSGNAQLGYGDGDEATVVGFGPDENERYITTYFRRVINVSNADLITELDAWILYDDGAIIFLNGTEVERINLPVSAIGNTTQAQSNILNNAEATFTIDPSLLVPGRNVIAVEIHQSSSGSSDISFDFSLTGVIGPGPVPPIPGTLDENYMGSINSDGTVAALALQPGSGKVLVGGEFTSLSGGVRGNFGRLETDGTLDTTFDPPGPDDLVRDILSLSTGEILVAGEFLDVGSSRRPGIAKFGGETGQHITNFFPEIGEPATVHGLAEQADGKLVLAGWFSGSGTPNGHRIDRLTQPFGSYDLSFNSPEASSEITCIARQTDGKILAGGTFQTIGGVTIRGIARFEEDGTFDTNFVPGTGLASRVRVIAVLGDGKILAGGDIYDADGALVHNLVRLNPDGSLDPTFHLPLVSSGSVYDVAMQDDGRILVAGDFRAVDGQAFSGIVRLHADGQIDSSFSPGTGIDGAGAVVRSVLLLPDDDFLIGGTFSSFDGTAVSGLAKLHGGNGPVGISFIERTILRRLVTLDASPTPGTQVYAHEELLPAGWQATDMNQGGSFDPITGKVKFGPFYDDLPRILSYRVVPAPDAAGSSQLFGASSADGFTSDTTGDSEFIALPRHPADENSADWRIEVQEVTAYGAAWRTGASWPVNPDPIPIDFVTRAAVLWQMGECYEVDSSITAPPLSWIPCFQVAADASEGAASVEAGVERLVGKTYVPGQALQVKLSAQPPSGTTAWAIQEAVPGGWNVVSVAAPGDHDTTNNLLKWGPFVGDEAREFFYTLLPPEDEKLPASFSGTSSFDGTSAPVEGVSEASATFRRVTLEFPETGGIQFRVLGLSGASVDVQVSSDLQSWVSMGTFVPSDGLIEVPDEEIATASQRYYRLAPVGE